MNRYIVITIVALMAACGSSKKSSAIEEELSPSLYYTSFTFSPKNSHPMTMSGIGNIHGIELLRKDDLEGFIESFYEHFTYTPILFSNGYWNKLECLGLTKGIDMRSWFNSFNKNYSTGNIIKEYNLILNDGNNVSIKIYGFFGNLEIKYEENYKDCLMTSSIELDINKIKSINKVAVLLPKEE